MTTYGGFRSITDLQTRLYQRENQFNSFKDIDEEKLARIIKIKDSITSAFNDRYQGKRKSNPLNIEGLDLYLSFLNYVTNPQIHTTLPSFDERVLLLIMGADPQLHSFYKYLEAPAVEETIKKNGETTKRQYIDEQTYSSEVRDEIGFYDPKIRIFEEAYFKKYISKNQLVRESKRSKMNQLMNRAEKVKNFDSISDIRFEELKAMAEQYHLEFENADYKTISYHVGIQYDYFRLKTIAEQELMLILLLDPNMKALQIYEEESQVKNIALRCKDTLGFYSSSLIRLEKKYHQKFYPEVKLNQWAI